MKRSQSSKLRLSRETLRTISDAALGGAGGAARKTGLNDSVGPEGQLCDTTACQTVTCQTICGPCDILLTPVVPPPFGFVVRKP